MTEEKKILARETEKISAAGGLRERKESPGRKPRLKFIFVTLVVMGIIGYLMYTGIEETMGYYLSVSELIEQGPQLSKEGVRVSGKVHEGSVKWDPGEQTLHFAIADEKTTLAVVYQGIVPDTFKQGQKVIIEGIYADGVFTASQLMTTCASKYE